VEESGFHTAPSTGFLRIAGGVAWVLGKWTPKNPLESDVLVNIINFAMSHIITPFESIRRTNPTGNEFWSSRDFAKVLGYVNYRHFEAVISKAKTACIHSGQRVEDHFVGSDQLIEIGKGGQRPVKTEMMSRYACYLVIQNADPAKEIVAQGQTYFAIQTRRQELGDEEMEEKRRLAIRSDLRTHNTQLADAAKQAGVIESRDYAIFQNHGYIGLYGGLGAQDIHRRKSLRKNEQILDHMGSTELAANLFRATQAEDKLRRERITGKDKANQAHREVGAKVRQTIKELGGTMPEELPPAESIRKLKSKARKELRKPEP
jgi:DNA-damage-inducible protein D